MTSEPERASAAGLDRCLPESTLLSQLMDPEHLGRMKPSALSFTRSLVRRMRDEKWTIRPIRFEVDPQGKGLIIYRIEALHHTFHFVISSDVLAEEERQERVIGAHWEVMASLVTGDLSDDRIERIMAGMPNRILGRAEPDTLLWCYAQRSGRVFDHVVECLAAGHQPDTPLVVESGYLLRNSGTYDNGLRGTSEITGLEPGNPLGMSHHTKMLALYLMREFSVDLVEEMARQRGAAAIGLDRTMRRRVGLGNASGVGLVLFVANHPQLINRWLEMRLIALATVLHRSPDPTNPEVDRLLDLIDFAIQFRAEDRIVNGFPFTPNEQIVSDLCRVRTWVEEFRDAGTIAGGHPSHPWQALDRAAAAAIDAESVETLRSLLIELDPELIRVLDAASVLLESRGIMSEMTVGELSQVIQHEYQWALSLDLESPAAYHYIWYRSRDNEEPRIGVRSLTPDLIDFAPDIPGDAQRLQAELLHAPMTQSVAEFLVAHPEYRAPVERIHSLIRTSYHTPHANLHAHDYSAVHVMRFVLSALFGLERLEAKSERWVRGILFQGAPFAAELGNDAEDDVWLVSI